MGQGCCLSTASFVHDAEIEPSVGVTLICAEPTALTGKRISDALKRFSFGVDAEFEFSSGR
jgi:hypothetical protein